MGISRVIGALFVAIVSGLFMYWALDKLYSLNPPQQATQDLPTLFGWGAGLGVFGIIMLSSRNR